MEGMPHPSDCFVSKSTILSCTGVVMPGGLCSILHSFGAQGSLSRQGCVHPLAPWEVPASPMVPLDLPLLFGRRRAEKATGPEWGPCSLGKEAWRTYCPHPISNPLPGPAHLQAHPPHPVPPSHCPDLLSRQLSPAGTQVAQGDHWPAASVSPMAILGLHR